MENDFEWEYWTRVTVGLPHACKRYAAGRVSKFTAIAYPRQRGLVRKKVPWDGRGFSGSRISGPLKRLKSGGWGFLVLTEILSLVKAKKRSSRTISNYVSLTDNMSVSNSDSRKPLALLDRQNISQSSNVVHWQIICLSAKGKSWRLGAGGYWPEAAWMYAST